MALNPVLIGGALGAASSLLGGSKQAGTTTTTQDIPAWLKPYVMGNLDMAGGFRDDLAGAGTPLLGASQDELLKILSGAYLTPESNPALKGYGDAVADTIGSRVDSRFSAAGRYGSGAHADTLAKSIGEAILPLYSGAYENERSRMYGGSVAAPGVVQGGVQAEFQPFTSYASLFPNVRSTEEPYFRNKTGELLSGALAGAGLGRMYGKA
jgi:hypothetical protein